MEAVPSAWMGPAREEEVPGVPTIAEVAERAGVGVGTVSRVLNGSPAVSRATRGRVLAVIDELGYAPNAAARALSTGRTCTVGVVAPFLTRPSVVERLRGVSRRIAAAGYQLVLFDVERPRPLAELAGAGRMDGLVLISLVPRDAELERLRAAGIPVVLVDAEHPDLPCVFIDDVEGGRLAAEHLLRLGHRRIGFIGDAEGPFGFTSTPRRREGAARACAAAGAELLVRSGPHGRDRARVLAAELLAAPGRPTAIFAASDTQALGVLEAADAAGLRVPRDLSVVGFDDVEMARYAGLTTVAQPLEESGLRGAELLLGALDGAPGMRRRLPLELVVRWSTCDAGIAVRQEEAARTEVRGASRHDGMIRSVQVGREGRS
jgi:DNA-binding LacI/PurR family transcriptional regulator